MLLPSNTCQNINNGKRILFNGNVTAADDFLACDSGDFLYGISFPFVRDTTHPVIDTITTQVIDSASLLIRSTTNEDATMVLASWLIYQVNGGPGQYHFLAYEDSTLGDGTTTFFDTLRISTDSSLVTFKVTSRNSYDLRDTSSIDSCWVYGVSSSSIDRQKFRNSIELRVRSTRESVIVYITDGTQSTDIKAALYDIQGRKRLSPNISRIDSGLFQLIINKSEIAAGEYILNVSGAQTSSTTRLSIVPGVHAQ